MDIAAILSRKFNNDDWTLNGDDYSGLTWLSKNKVPTEKELIDLWPTVKVEIQAEAEAKATARESALVKLAALGLTADEVAAL
jgi:hypothetical protein